MWSFSSKEKSCIPFPGLPAFYDDEIFNQFHLELNSLGASFINEEEFTDIFKPKPVIMQNTSIPVNLEQNEHSFVDSDCFIQIKELNMPNSIKNKLDNKKPYTTGVIPQIHYCWVHQSNLLMLYSTENKTEHVILDDFCTRVDDIYALELAGGVDSLYATHLLLIFAFPYIIVQGIHFNLPEFGYGELITESHCFCSMKVSKKVNTYVWLQSAGKVKTIALLEAHKSVFFACRDGNVYQLSIKMIDGILKRQNVILDRKTNLKIAERIPALFFQYFEKQNVPIKLVVDCTRRHLYMLCKDDIIKIFTYNETDYNLTPHIVVTMKDLLESVKKKSHNKWVTNVVDIGAVDENFSAIAWFYVVYNSGAKHFFAVYEYYSFTQKVRHLETLLFLAPTDIPLLESGEVTVTSSCLIDPTHGVQSLADKDGNHFIHVKRTDLTIGGTSVDIQDIKRTWPIMNATLTVLEPAFSSSKIGGLKKGRAAFLNLREPLTLIYHGPDMSSVLYKINYPWSVVAYIENYVNSADQKDGLVRSQAFYGDFQTALFALSYFCKAVVALEKRYDYILLYFFNLCEKQNTYAQTLPGTNVINFLSRSTESKPMLIAPEKVMSDALSHCHHLTSEFSNSVIVKSLHSTKIDEVEQHGSTSNKNEINVLNLLKTEEFGSQCNFMYNMLNYCLYKFIFLKLHPIWRTKLAELQKYSGRDKLFSMVSPQNLSYYVKMLAELIIAFFEMGRFTQFRYSSDKIKTVVDLHKCKTRMLVEFFIKLLDRTRAVLILWSIICDYDLNKFIEKGGEGLGRILLENNIGNIVADNNKSRTLIEGLIRFIHLCNNNMFNQTVENLAKNCAPIFTRDDYYLTLAWDTIAKMPLNEVENIKQPTIKRAFYLVRDTCERVSPACMMELFIKFGAVNEAINLCLLRWKWLKQTTEKKNMVQEEKQSLFKICLKALEIISKNCVSSDKPKIYQFMLPLFAIEDVSYIFSLHVWIQSQELLNQANEKFPNFTKYLKCPPKELVNLTQSIYPYIDCVENNFMRVEKLHSFYQEKKDYLKAAKWICYAGRMVLIEDELLENNYKQTILHFFTLNMRMSKFSRAKMLLSLVGKANGLNEKKQKLARLLCEKIDKSIKSLKLQQSLIDEMKKLKTYTNEETNDRNVRVLEYNFFEYHELVNRFLNESNLYESQLLTLMQTGHGWERENIVFLWSRLIKQGFEICARRDLPKSSEIVKGFLIEPIKRYYTDQSGNFPMHEIFIFVSVNAARYGFTYDWIRGFFVFVGMNEFGYLDCLVNMLNGHRHTFDCFEQYRASLFPYYMAVDALEHLKHSPRQKEGTKLRQTDGKVEHFFEEIKISTNNYLNGNLDLAARSKEKMKHINTFTL